MTFMLYPDTTYPATDLRDLLSSTFTPSRFLTIVHWPAKNMILKTHITFGLPPTTQTTRVAKHKIGNWATLTDVADNQPPLVLRLTDANDQFRLETTTGHHLGGFVCDTNTATMLNDWYALVKPANPWLKTVDQTTGHAKLDPVLINLIAFCQSVTKTTMLPRPIGRQLIKACWPIADVQSPSLPQQLRSLHHQFRPRNRPLPIKPITEQRLIYQLLTALQPT